jgi:hypothetical protein
MRADAAQNHDRIVRAFLSLVDERSIEPTMSSVAVEADVASTRPAAQRLASSSA